jgi:L-2,4-diaminobutyrate decarboxylase
MHQPSPDDETVLSEVGRWALGRLAHRDQSLPPRPRPDAMPEFTAEGAGVASAWRWLQDVILPTALPTDHPRYLAFVGGAPTVAGVIADMAVSASSIYGGSELEAGAVVAAERAAVRWLCDLVGLPPTAHGTFVSGGSLANLSALVAARKAASVTTGARPSVIIAGATAHASVHNAAEIMGCDVITAGAADRPLRACDVAPILGRLPLGEAVAVVASAGATNTGAIDELSDLAALCSDHGVWLHVDAAYGGAAMLSARVREQFDGIQRADSVTVDPHKWLFTPFDCAAVLYRDAETARRAHRQSAHYLDPANAADADNPADYAVHLTRRARGVPLWASLMANGVDAYRDAIEHCLDVAGYAAKQIEDYSYLEVVSEPSLSIVLLRRLGWRPEDYAGWSRRAVEQGIGLVTPTRFGGETVLRLCFVNPLTTPGDVDLILAELGSIG